MGDRTLDFLALGILLFVVITLIYTVIFIHDIPYEIAKKRNHPHQDAIHTAGWVSLFLMHTIWPFLWIWATLYKPDRGWGIGSPSKEESTKADSALLEKIRSLETSVAQREQKLSQQIQELNRRINDLEKSPTTTAGGDN